MKFKNEVLARLAKPCPMCGSREVMTDRPSFFREKELGCTSIYCKKCNLEIWGYGTDFNTAYHEALKNWNRRAA